MRELHPIVSNPEVFTPKFIFNRIVDAAYNFQRIVNVRREENAPMNDIDMHLTNAFKGEEEIFWWMDLRTLDMEPMFSRDSVPKTEKIFVGTGTNETNVRVAF